MTLDEQLRLSSNLMTLRKAAKLNQSDVAVKLSICRSTYCQFEQGDRLPDIDTLQRLSQIYCVTIDSLLNCNVQTVLKDFFLHAGQTHHERRLIKIYSELSQFAKGQLIERAEELARLDALRRNGKLHTG